MHAVHLLPRHLVRMAAFALALTVVVVVVAGWALRAEVPTATSEDPAPVTAPKETPAWISDPAAPPALLRER